MSNLLDLGGMSGAADTSKQAVLQSMDQRNASLKKRMSRQSNSNVFSSDGVKESEIRV